MTGLAIGALILSVMALVVGVVFVVADLPRDRVYRRYRKIGEGDDGWEWDEE